MSVLDDVADVFNDVFGAILPTGTLTRLGFTSDGKGGGVIDESSSSTVSLLRETWSARERAEIGAEYTDVKFIIMQQYNGVQIDPGPTVDDELSYNGQTFLLKEPIEADPAAASWVARGVLKK